MVKDKVSPGDLVEVHLSKIIYEGTLLESAQDEKGVLLLKLGSGYNMGFLKKDILEVKLLKEKGKEEKPLSVKKNPKKPSIAIIMTGGTIAARLNPKKGGVDWLDTPESLFKFYPNLFNKVNVATVDIPFMKASEDMDFRDWKVLARVCEKHLNDPNIKGIILTHGTDFLHYTSAALSFFLGEVNKPVVLTYSQRSIDRASSDANLNLECAALVAISDITEIMIVGHATTNDNYCYGIPGTKTRKMHSSTRDAFKPINTVPFVKIYPDRIEKIGEYRTNKKTKVSIDTSFEEKVALVKIYPGQDPEILDYYAKKRYKGLVLEMSGLGHAPTSRARKGWTNKLKEIQKKGMIVCATAQTVYGRLDPYVYSNGRELLKTGIIFLEDMLSETALIKLGWVLGHKEWSKDKEVVKEKMLHNFSREINPRLTYSKE